MDTWIIFDFDGTLADTLDAGITVLNSLAKKFGFRQISPEDRERLRDKAPMEILKDVGISMWELPRVARAVRVQLLTEGKPSVAYPGIENLLHELRTRGFHLAILTSGSLEKVMLFLKAHNLEGIFEFTDAESNLFGKGRVLKRLMKVRGIAPAAAVYVGDEIRDIQAARQAGVKIVSVSWGVNSKKALQAYAPDFLVDKPEDLLEVKF